jgi:hypothetical protein
MADQLKCPYCHNPVEDHKQWVVCRTLGCYECDDHKSRPRIKYAVINQTQKEIAMKFKGNNTLELCEDDMLKAMEDWINLSIFKKAISVTGIDKRTINSNSSSFVIHFTAAPPEFED